LVTLRRRKRAAPNTKWYEIAKLLYVGLTRPRYRVIATGTLPERLYTPRFDSPAVGWDEALEPLTASDADRIDDSATGVDEGADDHPYHWTAPPGNHSPPKAENRNG